MGGPHIQPPLFSISVSTRPLSLEVVLPLRSTEIVERVTSIESEKHVFLRLKRGDITG